MPKPFAGLFEHGLRAHESLRVFVPQVTVQFEPPARLNNGPLFLYNGLKIGRYSALRTGIVRNVESIGRYTSIGPGVVLGEAEHPIDWLSTSAVQYSAEQFGFYPPEEDAVGRIRPWEAEKAANRPVVIGNDVWIGANAIIRAGVSVGDGAIIGAGSFVNRNVEPYSIVGGVPAHVIGSRFDESTVQSLVDLNWWEFDVSALAGIAFDQVDSAIEEIRSREATGTAVRVPLTYSAVDLCSDGYLTLRVNPLNERLATERREKFHKAGQPTR